MNTVKNALVLAAGTAAAISFARPAPGPALAARLAEGPEIIGIVHWGLNTYTDREWGYGDEDPAMLNPDAFDADQIVGACKAGGIGGLVVVAKHHDGFCLWPTKTTEHNIAKTPFWRGTGNEERGTGRDYVKEMSEACRRAGLKFGVYCSPWDRNNAAYATEKYVETYHAQVKELLDGRYGEVFEMWFDGANGGDGYYGGAREKRRIKAGYYRLDELMRTVRSLQPGVTIFSGERDDSDFRWPGNEQGIVSPDSRATICTVGGFEGGKYGNPDYKPQINTGSSDGGFFRVCEGDFPLRRGWFHHERERGTTKSAAYLAKLYLSSVGNAGTMNIGVAPTKAGRLDADDVKALAGFRVLKDAIFANEAKEGEEFNVVVMREDISNGELVDSWGFTADGKTILSGKSIGLKRIRLLDKPCVARNCEVRVLKSEGTPKVSFTLYRADEAVVEAILNATCDDGETDTANWMASNPDEVRPVPGREPSLLPSGKKFTLVWHDEFDGDTLDETKWSYRTNFWGQSAHWFATPEDNAVEVKDGLLHLKLIKRADGQFVSPQLQTGELVWDVPHEKNPKGFWPLPKRGKPKFMHRYGYYECRCRLQQMPGWMTAFWMQTPMQGCSLDPRRAGIEHDIMESVEPDEVIPHSFHANGYGADHLNFHCPRDRKNVKNPPARLHGTVFHTFGMLWEPDGYTLYIDGVQHGPKVGGGEGEAVSQTEEFILLTTEAKWYRNDHMTGKGVPELEAAAAAGDEFLVDYVRVYDIAE